MVLAAAVSDQFDLFIANLAPVAPEYARLMKEKFRLEAMIADGGYGPAVEATSLAPGASGPAVIQLRDRLTLLGYLGAALPTAMTKPSWMPCSGFRLTKA